MLARILLLGALVGSATLGIAQDKAITPLDLTKRETRLSSRRWQGPGLAPLTTDDTWPGRKTIRFQAWHGAYSSLGRKRAAVGEADVRRTELVELGAARAVPRVGAERARSESSDRRSRLANLERVGSAGRYPGDVRLQELITTEVEITRDAFIAGKRAPRMEDINRFVFRKNGADESGPVPVVGAATGGDDTADKR